MPLPYLNIVSFKVVLYWSMPNLYLGFNIQQTKLVQRRLMTFLRGRQSVVEEKLPLKKMDPALRLMAFSMETGLQIASAILAADLQVTNIQSLGKNLTLRKAAISLGGNSSSSTLQHIFYEQIQNFKNSASKIQRVIFYIEESIVIKKEIDKLVENTKKDMQFVPETEESYESVINLLLNQSLKNEALQRQLMARIYSITQNVDDQTNHNNAMAIDIYGVEDEVKHVNFLTSDINKEIDRVVWETSKLIELLEGIQGRTILLNSDAISEISLHEDFINKTILNAIGILKLRLEDFKGTVKSFNEKRLKQIREFTNDAHNYPTERENALTEKDLSDFLVETNSKKCYDSIERYLWASNSLATDNRSRISLLVDVASYGQNQWLVQEIVDDLKNKRKDNLNCIACCIDEWNMLARSGRVLNDFFSAIASKLELPPEVPNRVKYAHIMKERLLQFVTMLHIWQSNVRASDYILQLRQLVRDDDRQELMYRSQRDVESQMENYRECIKSIIVTYDGSFGACIISETISEALSSSRLRCDTIPIVLYVPCNTEIEVCRTADSRNVFPAGTHCHYLCLYERKIQKKSLHCDINRMWSMKESEIVSILKKCVRHTRGITEYGNELQRFTNMTTETTADIEL